MFGLASGVYQNYFAPPKVSILIVGLDGSGKTALLERIKVTNISTQLNLCALPPSYFKEAAALVMGTSNFGVAADEVPAALGGGAPARLPPPLPSENAIRSRKFVKKILGCSSTSQNQGLDEDEREISEAARQFINIDIPPPPFDMSGNNFTQPAKKSTTNDEREDAAVNPNGNARSSFINLLRCPSSSKYTTAAVEGEEDEYLDEYNGEKSTVSSQSGKNNNEKWDEEYLKDYHIDYNENQQFDIKNSKAKMFPLDKIRPTLGQNLAKLDMCGCKCSLFDLSGAEKMRPLWERYYHDADAIVYVVNCADTSFINLEKARSEFQQLCQNDSIQRHCRAGLPILIFANQIDLAYREYEEAIGGLSNSKREVSWNADEEDDFVGGGHNNVDKKGAKDGRALEFHDLATLFGLHDNNENNNNVFLLGGSAKSGEGVRAAMEVLMAHAKRYHLGRRR